MQKNVFIIIGVMFFFVSGILTAFSIALPINLTNDEIAYYTEIAENVWYNGMNEVAPNDDIVIKHDLNAKIIRISSKQSNKQSISVDFSSGKGIVTINNPDTSFVGCIIFYGLLWTLIAGVLVAIIQNSLETFRIAKSRE